MSMNILKEKIILFKTLGCTLLEICKDREEENMPTDIPGERNMVKWDKKQSNMSQRNKKYLLEVLADTHLICHTSKSKIKTWLTTLEVHVKWRKHNLIEGFTYISKMKFWNLVRLI